MNNSLIKLFVALAMACGACFLPSKASSAESAVEVPVFINIGQSNADGSAMFNPELDEEMLAWYTSPANSGNMKIWYRSTQVQNQESNKLGESARWVVDGAITDVEPGWLELWYRNENLEGRTAMNMIHGYGTYSTGSGTDCAQGRRGMEGAFGRSFQENFPESELYIIKLGVSGSAIASWANPLDDHNWNYFYDNVFTPAIADLLQKGKRPVLAGVWYMQGCADSGKTYEYYKECLERLVQKIGTDLGFPGAHIYVGHIVKPGESTVTPTGSTQYGENVRRAQDDVAAAHANVETVDTKDFPLQYEEAFKGYIHFSHAGVNDIGRELAARVSKAGPRSWSKFTTPGRWIDAGTTAVFIPKFGTPEITYTTRGDMVTATITYPGFTDTICHQLPASPHK
ncbi:MAG: sialate O-acetylesterase [Firmicutes bacterium]|nr:sialate O-acetylesterase [Bacillota bacterium]MCM1401807.1 sialate O-acetylesterase [Bacteroides sp.]MCM1477688.1 sialate O-acetylesterase [Bacteroides sp.]